MKKKATIISLLMVIAAFALAESFKLSTGYGKQASISTNITTIAISELNVDDVFATSLSLFNAGTSLVFCAINTTDLSFRTALTNKTAVPVPKSMVYTFTGHQIKTLHMATTNGIADVYVGAN